MEPELLNQIPESLRAQVASAFSGKDEQVSQANQQVDQVKEQVNKANARIAQLEDYIERLKEQVRLYFLKKYGPKSEQLTDAQLTLLELEPIVSLAEVEAEAALPEADKAVDAAPEQAEESKGERKKPVRAPLSKLLPREERIIKLPIQLILAGQPVTGTPSTCFFLNENVALNQVIDVPQRGIR